MKSETNLRTKREQVMDEVNTTQNVYEFETPNIVKWITEATFPWIYGF